MKQRWFLISIVLLLVSLLVTGCGVAQEDYAAAQGQVASLQSELAGAQSDLAAAQGQMASLQSELAGAQSDLAAAQGQVASLQSELAGARSDLAAAQGQVASLQDDYENVSAELAEIKQVYPPGDFKSLTELEAWVANHVQPSAMYLDGDFRSALKIQSQGLDDGYLISVVFDEDDTDPTGGWIYCGALVNGGLYVWFPFDTVVYSLADKFIR